MQLSEGKIKHFKALSNDKGVIARAKAQRPTKIREPNEYRTETLPAFGLLGLCFR